MLAREYPALDAVHLERFLSKIEISDSGCWNWLGGLVKGYGRFAVKRIAYQAHRIAYLLWIADALASDVHLDHLCRNRGCVNPDHLEPVTCAENLLRGNTVNAVNRAKTHCDKGHPLEGLNVYLKPNGCRNCKTCRREAQRRYWEAA